MTAPADRPAAESFTDDELRRIVVEFMRGGDDRFYGADSRHPDRMTGFCVWCHNPVSPPGEHAASCEGQARMALAAKAKRMQIAAPQPQTPPAFDGGRVPAARAAANLRAALAPPEEDGR